MTESIVTQHLSSRHPPRPNPPNLHPVLTNLKSPPNPHPHSILKATPHLIVLQQLTPESDQERGFMPITPPRKKTQCVCNLFHDVLRVGVYMAVKKLHGSSLSVALSLRWMVGFGGMGTGADEEPA